ncbi:GL16271 [Drosophila persimilis]|uniref:PCI domain-containing protein 2 homolog n=2 Tax=pseudoobscura subgroup TaxID=32358 RepID=Q2LZ67_DROPS|nr:PCI domain-containing protein 2 homolog [Drosophila pseudoobscura]XP_002027865.1 PCI domain-containing protein 2 homolog [Drosophila persimilis]EDW37584.1 GL16271 [Drosophila persimilis]
MFGSLANYLSNVERCAEACSGQALSDFLSLRDVHVQNDKLHVAQPEKMVERYLDAPLDEVVGAHLKVIYYLAQNPTNYMEAYTQQAACCSAVVKLLQMMKDENWCLPVMYRVCLDLRYLAQACEKHGRSFTPGQILEKAADCMMACFRVCAADGRASEEETKRLGMMNLVNQLFKIYFRINKLHLCKPLIRAIDNCAFKDTFPLPEQITYKYFVGRRAMFDSNYRMAVEDLSYAFTHCPDRFGSNKRLILIYLVPVKMLLGYLPSKVLLQRHDLLLFHDLAQTLKAGNVNKFDEIVRENEKVLIRSGIYLLVEKLKFIVYRNLFKKVFAIRQTHQLDLGDFMTALQFVGVTDVSLDETHCIIANLIYEGKIKGYISYAHNKLVVSKQNPFPPLISV